MNTPKRELLLWQGRLCSQEGWGMRSAATGTAGDVQLIEQQGMRSTGVSVAEESRGCTLNSRGMDLYRREEGLAGCGACAIASAAGEEHFEAAQHAAVRQARNQLGGAQRQGGVGGGLRVQGRHKGRAHDRLLGVVKHEGVADAAQPRPDVGDGLVAAPGAPVALRQAGARGGGAG